jgi:carbon storage regulator
MLVLTRKEGECIVINDQVVVTVLQVRTNRIRIGIAAPKDVPIRRSDPGRSGASKTSLTTI